MEKSINELVARTIILRTEGKLEEALETAKEGVKKEQLLRKIRKANNMPVGSELMYSTWFNLATTYEANDLPDDAIKTYSYLAKQKGNPFTGRIRINMGNVYYSQQKYPSAIKMYKMALDLTRRDDGSISHKIRRNIGNAYFRMGKLLDAVKNYEDAMGSAPEFQTGFNLLVCHLSLGDVDNMKNDFLALIDIPLDRDEIAAPEDILMTNASEVEGNVKEANHFLLAAARLIAPMLDSADWSAGYDWVCDALDDNHEEIAMQMKLEQASQQLKRKDFQVAITSLKILHKRCKDKGATATNLSFVSFLEDNIHKASEYADIALAADRYDAKALVNKGNCHFVNGDITSAKDLYLEAVGVQADCVQAIYNLGLANAQLGQADEAIHAFEKAHKLTPNNPQIIYQIADIYELQGRTVDAIKWFNVLSARVPSDPTILSRLAACYAETKDEAQSLHHLLESFRHSPTDLDVISSIGSFFVQQEMYDRCIYFFQQAYLIEPQESKWGFTLASAHKKVGDHDLAFLEYEKLHNRFPENEKVLRCLIDTSNVLGKPSFSYEAKLERLLSAREAE